MTLVFQLSIYVGKWFFECCLRFIEMRPNIDTNVLFLTVELKIPCLALKYAIVYAVVHN